MNSKLSMIPEPETATSRAWDGRLPDAMPQANSPDGKGKGRLPGMFLFIGGVGVESVEGLVLSNPHPRRARLHVTERSGRADVCGPDLEL